MERHDPEDLIETVEREWGEIADQYPAAAEWFLERPGLTSRGETVDALADHLDVDRETANLVVGHLVEDDVDPVQQIVRPNGEKYVGVIDHTEHEWFYAFDRYDDVDGRQRRAVCAHCVHEERAAADVAHVTRSPTDYDLDRARTALAIHYHVDHEGREFDDVLSDDLGVDPEAFAGRHGLSGTDSISLRDVTRRIDEDPALESGRAGVGDSLSVPEVDVEPGASLVSGTTIGGNTAWHAGNDGAGSGLDADTLDGRQASEVDTLLWRYPSGSAKIASTKSTQISTYPSASTYQTWTATATSAWGAAFLAASYDPVYFSVDVYRNGSTLPVGTSTYLTRDVTTSDSFTFVFHAETDGAYLASVSASVRGARTIPAPVTS